MNQHKTPTWKKFLFQEVPLIIVMHVIMLSFVLSVFAMSKANAAEFHMKEPKIFLDINVGSRHSQDYYYLNTDKYFVGRDGETRYLYTVTEEREFNEKNLGLGIRYEYAENFDLSVGFYDNSFNKTSVYVGAEAHTSRKRLISLGVAVALVSGYSGTPSDTIAVFLPTVQIGIPQVGIRIGHVPFGTVKLTTAQLYFGFDL